MELKISNKVNNLRWKWDWYMIKFNLWKIRFNIDTMNLRIMFNPTIIKLKIKGKLNRIGWKFYRLKIEFRSLKHRIAHSVNIKFSNMKY